MAALEAARYASSVMVKKPQVTRQVNDSHNTATGPSRYEREPAIRIRVVQRAPVVLHLFSASANDDRGLFTDIRGEGKSDWLKSSRTGHYRSIPAWL